jgi:hypothetical protein
LAHRSCKVCLDAQWWLNEFLPARDRQISAGIFERLPTGYIACWPRGLLSRRRLARANLGGSLTLQSIAVALVGRVSLRGGEGAFVAVPGVSLVAVATFSRSLSAS